MVQVMLLVIGNVSVSHYIIADQKTPVRKTRQKKSERLFYSYSEFVRVKTVPRVFPEAQSLTPKQGVLCNSGKKKTLFTRMKPCASSDQLGRGGGQAEIGK